ERRAARTRALLVPALSVCSFVLTLFWLASDRSAVQARPGAALIVALIYTCLLAVRVLGAAFGPVRVRAAVVAVVLVLASPWSIGMLNLDTRLWVVEEDEPAQTQEPDEETEADALFYDQPAQIAAAVARVTGTRPRTTGVYFVGFAVHVEQVLLRR